MHINCEIKKFYDIIELDWVLAKFDTERFGDI